MVELIERLDEVIGEQENGHTFQGIFWVDNSLVKRRKLISPGDLRPNKELPNSSYIHIQPKSFQKKYVLASLYYNYLGTRNLPAANRLYVLSTTVLEVSVEPINLYELRYARWRGVGKPEPIPQKYNQLRVVSGSLSRAPDPIDLSKIKLERIHEAVKVFTAGFNLPV